MSYTIKQYDMQDDETRRKVFWLLKRLTSYTLWKKKRDAWEIFAKAFEDAVKTWPKDQPEQMEADRLIRIYDIVNLYSKGLPELAKGNRHVWREGQALNEAMRSYAAVSSVFYRDPNYWERGMQLAPYPPKVETLNKLMLASEYQGDQAPQEVPNRVAYWKNPGNLINPEAYKYEFHELPYPIFPELLPKVPDGTDTFIQSDQIVPVDGIWEPVKIEQNKVLGIIPVGKKTISNNGCFNYFVRETKAPKFRGSYNKITSRYDNIATHWRLLWEDTRYKDGIIPDESEYFLEAKPTVVSPDLTTTPPADVRTGELCPASGLWAAKGYNSPPIQILEGRVMPDLMVRQVGEMRVHFVTWQFVKPV